MPITADRIRQGNRGADRAVLAARRSEKLAKAACFVCAAVSILTTIGIIYFLLADALQFFKTVSIAEFLFGTKWSPLIKPHSFGVLPLVAGTAMITIGAAIIALPLGMMTAIFMSEYAHPKLRRVLKPILELLAGVPTVVYGYFAVLFITPTLKNFFPVVQVFNAASGAIVVGIMVLPLVASLCEDALSAVPRALREGAYGLGSTKFEVVVKIVTPAALSGIMAAFILAISRAVGETMAVTLASGQSPKLTFNPAESIQTMTAYIVQISKGDTPAGSLSYNTIFAVGLALFAITFGLNLLAERFVRRYRQVYR